MVSPPCVSPSCGKGAVRKTEGGNGAALWAGEKNPSLRSPVPRGGLSGGDGSRQPRQPLVLLLILALLPAPAVGRWKSCSEKASSAVCRPCSTSASPFGRFAV